MDSTENTNATRRGSELSEGLGPLPPGNEPWCFAYTSADMKAYALAEVQRAVAAERERWIAICKEHAADTDPPHKPYEETYGDGWLDACNEIMWAGEKA